MKPKGLALEAARNIRSCMETMEQAIEGAIIRAVAIERQRIMEAIGHMPYLDPEEVFRIVCPLERVGADEQLKMEPSTLRAGSYGDWESWLIAPQRVPVTDDVGGPVIGEATNIRQEGEKTLADLHIPEAAQQGLSIGQIVTCYNTWSGEFCCEGAVYQLYPGVAVIYTGNGLHQHTISSVKPGRRVPTNYAPANPASLLPQEKPSDPRIDPQMWQDTQEAIEADDGQTVEEILSELQYRGEQAALAPSPFEHGARRTPLE